MREYKLNFYDVDKDYVKWLQNKEKEARGFSCVPNMEYSNRQPKFVCGIVKIINGFKYYVPVSSYNIQKSENILIKISDKQKPIAGSLRFNFMFPVPDEKIAVRKINDIKDNSYKQLIFKEFNFIQNNTKVILLKADNTYSSVINRTSQQLIKNSCDFKLLETKCIEYCKLHGLETPRASEEPEQTDIASKLEVAQAKAKETNDIHSKKQNKDTER